MNIQIGKFKMTKFSKPRVGKHFPCPKCGSITRVTVTRTFTHPDKRLENIIQRTRKCRVCNIIFQTREVKREVYVMSETISEQENNNTDK